jgi:hypothetical protein
MGKVAAKARFIYNVLYIMLPIVQKNNHHGHKYRHKGELLPPGADAEYSKY